MTFERDQDIGTSSDSPEPKDILAVDVGVEHLRAVLSNLYRPSMVAVSVEKVIVANGAYAAGDVVNDASGTAWHFKNMVRQLGGGGYITGALITAETTAIASLFTLFLHTDTPTCDLDDADENTAPIKADRHIYVGRIEFAACSDVGAGMSETEAVPSTIGRLPKGFVCKSNSRDLYGVLAISNALDLVDFTTLTITLIVEQM